MDAHWPKVVDESHTLSLLKSGRSISRFGDGEFEIILGNSIGFQKKNGSLALKLRDILNSDGECLIGIPNLLEINQGSADYWSERDGRYNELLNGEKTYHSSFISRPDKIQSINNPDFFSEFCSVWKGRRAIFLIGDGNQDIAPFNGSPSIYENTAEYEFWKFSSKHAFRDYDSILEKCSSQPRETIFAICLGPTATVLSFDLCNLGFQAIDLGSFPRFYFWRMNPSPNS